METRLYENERLYINTYHHIIVRRFAAILLNLKCAAMQRLSQIPNRRQRSTYAIHKSSLLVKVLVLETK